MDVGVLRVWEVCNHESYLLRKGTSNNEKEHIIEQSL